ncbi:MAG: alpha-ketoacid dehydrogenase subunit beta [Oscillospiraceae bacterium]|nr:alpha-ketoacid dehydrogenase subunit beta [Oscillospiraceae bacterium]
MAMREITYAQAVREAMSEEMRRDPDVFFMGEDIGVYCGAFGVSGGMLEEFGPERVMDTPISENGFVGAAVGAAITGTRPIVELMFSDFMAVCFDHILNQAPKMRYMFGGKVKVPMVLRAPSGGGTGASAQHSQSLEVIYAHIPGLKVVVPSTPYDAKGLLKTAIRDDNPVIFLEQKLLYRTKGEVPQEEYTIPFGQADVKLAGSDVTVITYGRMVLMCLEAAKKLAGEGIGVEVIDVRSLLPLDTVTLIESVKKTKHCVVVHEAVKFGGFGGELAATIHESDAFYYLDAPVKRLGAVSAPIPFNPILEKNCFPTVEGIIAAVRETLQ